MNNRIFISYSSKDASIAYKLVEYVERQGYSCWIAPRNITPGKDYTDLLNDALKGCPALIFIASEKSLRSQWVKKELTTAVSYNKKIIPFKIQNVVLDGGMEFILNNVQWIDASSNTSSHFPEIIEGLGFPPNSDSNDTNIIPVDKKTGRVNNTTKIAIIVAGLLVVMLTLIFVLRPVNELPEIPVTDSSISDTSDTEKKQNNDSIPPVVKPPQPPKEKPDKPQADSSKIKTPPGETPTEPPVPPHPPVDSSKISYQTRRNKAIRLQSLGRFKEAKKQYEDLYNDNPDDKELLTYIEQCKKNMN